MQTAVVVCFVCFLGENRIQVEMLSFHVSFDIVVGRTKHTWMLVLLYLLSVSLGRLTMGSQESKLQFCIHSPHLIVQ